MDFTDVDSDYTEAPRRGPPKYTRVPHRNISPTTSPPLSPSYAPDRYSDPIPAQGYGGSGIANQGVRFDEAQLTMLAASPPMAGLKDQLALAAGRVTPGVDDTPYIQYALEALTRDPANDYRQHYPSGSSGSYQDQYSPPRGQEGQRAPVYTEPPTVHHGPNRFPTNLPHAAEAARTEKKLPPAEIPILDLEGSNRWAPVNEQTRRTLRSSRGKLMPLTYKPGILRPLSLLTLMLLCGLMAAGLIFSTTYSEQRDGLTPYAGTIYSGQYFVFRILPQFLAAIILIYAQSVVVTSFRILPFYFLAHERVERRHRALFRRLYPRSFLWPQLTGPWQVKAFGLTTWLMNFTIPLQSAVFTCVYMSGAWYWATVSSFVWALVALYILLLVVTGILLVFWFRCWTGLLWDMRSIGDLLPLLNHSNALDSYYGIDIAPGGKSFDFQLKERIFDRIGYWQMEDQNTQGVWYAIGASAADEEIRDHDKLMLNPNGKIEASRYSDGSRDGGEANTDWAQIRFRYLPWCLRDVPLMAFFAIVFILLLALLIISFIPQTRLDRGFNPLLSAKPTKEAFSAANFLYGFMPSLIGMIFFLLFQSLDQSLRILQPWGDLSQAHGARARKSILADYAACLPFQATWRAAMNCHWRVAITSLMGVLFVFIPVLAGGLFMALTNPHQEVRMYPNMPVFGVLLAFLFLYVGCVSLLLPRRRQFRLPHPVTNLAEVISFCTATQTTQDAAFRSVRSREDLEGRLGLDREDERQESMWCFGTATGDEAHHLSVRRTGHMVEKRPQSWGSMM